VPNAALTWQQAGVLAVALLVVAALSRRWAPTVGLAPFAREAGFIAALYTLWQYAGTAPAISADGAYSRARWIVRAERTLHLPSEADLQRLILPHPLLAQACNWYYATMHFAALFAMLLWLFVRHRDRYATVRTTIILLTVACLLIQFVPVAPPRLLPGFVDVAAQYGQSVYAAFGVGVDQLSAMPSVHVGWAFLVAGAVIWASPSRWRWCILVHPILTVFVVVATANHFWLDGIVAVVLLALAVGAQVSWFRAVRRRTARMREPGPQSAVTVTNLSGQQN
jgi:hypothetical protein